MDQHTELNQLIVMPANLFSYIMQLQGYNLPAAGKLLQRIQALSVDEFIDWQEKAKWDIAKYHYDHNNFYKEKVGNIFPTRWDDLPIITKKDLLQPFENLVTAGVKDYYKSSTSGTSGTPFFFAKDKFAHAMTWALIANRYRIYDITEHSLQARFFGISQNTIGYYKEKLKDLVMRRVRFDVFDLSDTSMAGFIQKFREHNFEYLYGYTNSLVLFARHLQRQQVTLKEICPTLKVCISTSEISTLEDHELFVKNFGVPHKREYGISETCVTAFDMADGNWGLSEETLFNEVINEKQDIVDYGEQGRLLSTSLFNKAMPMIRYDTGDIVTLHAAPAGSIYRSISSLSGRINDVAILPSGRVVPGATFYYVARSLFEKTNCLQEFMIKQATLHHFIFEIVTSRDLTAKEIREINQIISAYLEPGLTLTIKKVEKLDRTAAGKLKYFYSELNR
jgi:Coenzyme F390 synthetase